MTTIDGRVAVVTGAASGIGRSLAFALARRGCRLGLADIDRVGLAESARRCGELGAETLWSEVDVSDRTALERFAAAVIERFDEVHLVINNAGVASAGDAADQPVADIRRVIDVNLWGVIHGTQVFLPHLTAAGDAHLVNVSSLFGMLSMPTQSAYNATKFAVRGYTESLAAELALSDADVRVSCVHPGGVATAIARRARVTSAHDHEAMSELFDKLARVSPDHAAARILRGVERDRTRILVGADAYAASLLPRILGGRYVDVITWVSRRALPALHPRSGRRP